MQLQRSIIQRWQRLEHFASRGAIRYEVVLADLAVAEDDDAFGELCDVVLVCDHHDRESAVVQILKHFHDLDRCAAVEISGGLVGEQDRWTIHPQHIEQRVNLVVVAKSPPSRIREVAAGRGWRHLRLLSSANNTYNTDYHAENEKGGQNPILNVFVRRADGIYHTYATELLFGPKEEGMDGRHVDSIWPLWNAFDFTPDGRGTDWNPKLSY
jgi:hypothetical protein